MIDKQQLQAMGEHQAEQHMCMAKQIEDLQARLQECANGAAKMQEQRDAAYVMAGKSGLERDKFAQQLKAANRKIAVMAELLRGASPFLDYVQSGACHISNDDVSEAIELSDRIAAALAGELHNHIADASNMAPDGWQLVRIEHANDVAETVIEDHVVTEWDHRWQEISGYRCGYCSLSGNTCDDVINGEHDHDCVITKARSMLAAAPKLEQTK